MSESTEADAAVTCKQALDRFINEKQSDQFCKLVAEGPLSKLACQELDEALKNFTAEDIDALWDNLELLTQSTVLTSFGDNVPLETQDRAAVVLSNIATIAVQSLTPELQQTPHGLLQTALVLQGLLLEDLPNTFSNMKSRTAKLFENWWIQKRDRYQNFVVNFLVHLMKKLLAVKFVKADMKRLWSLQECIQYINFEDRSGSEFKKLVVASAASTDFLGQIQGRKFLSYCLCRSEELIEDVYHEIKSHLHKWIPSQARFYAEVFCRAWKDATPTIQHKLEFWCIQDMMEVGVRVERAKNSPAPAVRQFLKYYHRQKADRNIGDMLVRLYEPILWRSLKVPNADVRANAASIFFDAFPLELKSGNEEENDTLLQKQFYLMQDLLADTSPQVRAIAAVGVCSACTHFWEVIPVNVTHSLLTKLVEDLVVDSAACEVRAAVFMGFKQLLDNPLSHQLLYTILPKLRMSFHDIAENVRIGMLDLLLKTKNIKPFKYWKIVPFNDILARLKVDSRPVAVRIVKLLQNSFHPAHESNHILIERCISLVKMDRKASRCFYRYLYEVKTVPDLVEFMLLVCRILRQHVRKSFPPPRTDTPDNFLPFSEADGSEDEEDKENVSQNSENHEPGSDELDNPEMVAGLLDVISVLWAGVDHKLQQVPAHAQLKELLKKKIGNLVVMLAKHYRDTEVWDNLLYLGSFIESKLVPTLCKPCLVRVRALPKTATIRDYNTLAVCLCKWGCVSELMEIMSSWLDAGLNPNNKSVSFKRTGQRRRHVRFTDPYDLHPSLACDILSWMLTDPYCRNSLLAKDDCLFECWQQLQAIKGLIEKRLEDARTVKKNVHTTDEFLEKAFCLYCRITIHLEKRADHNILEEFGSILAWSEVMLLPVLRNLENSSHNSSRVSTRSFLQDNNIVRGLFQVIFLISSDMIMIGLTNADFCTHLTQVVMAALASGTDTLLLHSASKCMLQIVEFSKTRGCEDSALYASLVARLFGQILASLGTAVNNDEEEAKILLKRMKPLLTEILATSLSETITAGPITTMTRVVSAVIANLTDRVERDCGCEAFETTDSFPVLTAFILSGVLPKPGLTRLFINELERFVSSGIITQPPKILAVVALVHFLNEKSVLKEELKTLTEAASKLILEPDNSVSMNSTYIVEKDYLEVARKFIDKLNLNTSEQVVA